VQAVNRELANLTNLQVEDIKKLIRTVAIDGYIAAKPYYDYRHKAFVPFKDNYALQNIVKSIANRTADTYRNMSNSSAFMIRDRAHPRRLVPTTVSDTFQTVVDEAVQMVQSGVLDYGSAMRRTMKQLAKSGLRYVNYRPESGGLYTQRLDSALRRNLLDGVQAVSQGVQDEIGKQIGSDGKEISVHQMSAPDHEPIQGHQFTNEEYDKLQNSQPFMDYEGEHFAAIERHIGQYNCRHFTWSIILGVDKPNFTKQQLQDLIDKNNAGYDLPNGKHLTLYECSQKMREMETEIRRAKEGQMMAVEEGDLDLAKEYQAQVSQLVKEYKAFAKACGLTPDMTRCSVPGYKQISLKS
ncbi:MAG: hypothetical protein J6O49_07080, partial [Bacteroidaceae bacterium]|nr:hypothetical protein [Bacteroidaceae bacterium]